MMKRGPQRAACVLSERGFSLIEVLVVIIIIGIVAAMAFPSYQQWREGVDYRNAARMIFSTLREARSSAISTNDQFRVEFDDAARRYGLRRGDRAMNTNWQDLVKVPVILPSSYTVLPSQTGLNSVSAELDAVSVPNVRVIVFSPNGSANQGPGANGESVINVLDKFGNTVYAVRVTPTGRISISNRLK